jgi:hypothetical protein
VDVNEQKRTQSHHANYVLMTKVMQICGPWNYDVDENDPNLQKAIQDEYNAWELVPLAKGKICGCLLVCL